MPTLYMLIGLPGSGKSTWTANQMFDWNNTVIASTDGFLDRFANDSGISYDDAFKVAYKDASNHLSKTIADAVKNGYNIIWDQTNVMKGARIKKLRKIPDSYKKIAVYFPAPDEKELARRLASRPGKTISPHIYQDMLNNLEIPTKDEGFDDVIII